MTPWQIAKESESSQQIALFCFAAKAQKLGFLSAKLPVYYKNDGTMPDAKDMIPELKFLHHIPNGGSRGDTAKSAAIAGGRLKAEGVKAGVLDIFWPVARMPRGDGFAYCGLYIEMKKPSLRKEGYRQAGCSKEQIEFGEFAVSQNYIVVTCYDWLEAAKVLEDYYNLGK